MISTADRAYAAGIIDGEGTIGIMRQKTHQKNGYRMPIRHCVRVQVANTDPQLIDWLLEIFGGRTTWREARIRTRKPLYYWQLKDQRAVDFIELILPHLRLKKEQAMLALKYRKTVGSIGKHSGPTPLSDDILELREAYAQEMNDLNRRGIAVGELG